MSITTIPPNEPTTIEKMKGLPWSIAGDSFNTVFVQFTFFGSVFILFLDALGLSKSQIGVMLSIFPFAGLIALFMAPTVARYGYKRTFLTFWGIRKIRSFRNYLLGIALMTLATVPVVSFLPLFMSEVKELLESLSDPRFNVRFEAIVAIGRTRPDAQLIEALAKVLHRNDPSMSVMAAWALGRIHDESAMKPLRAALDSNYRSVKAHSARSLGTLVTPR